MSPEARERSFDALATGLASGSISRGKAIKLMGAALVGGTLASLGIGGVAAAAEDDQGENEECKRNGKKCKRSNQCCSGNCVNGTCGACPPGSTLCGTTCCPGATCTCAPVSGGGQACIQTPTGGLDAVSDCALCSPTSVCVLSNTPGSFHCLRRCSSLA